MKLLSRLLRSPPAEKKPRDIECHNCHKCGHLQGRVLSKGRPEGGAGVAVTATTKQARAARQSPAQLQRQRRQISRRGQLRKKRPRPGSYPLKFRGRVVRLWGCHAPCPPSCNKFVSCITKSCRGPIVAADKRVFYAVGIGDLAIEVPHGKSPTPILLRETLHAPGA